MKESSFNSRLGEHLRRVRRQKGLSLQDVEAASGKEFKASVLGAYERGERSMSVGRLARLAEIYRIPLPAMLPGDGAPGAPALEGGLAIDISRLRRTDAPEADLLRRYAESVQLERGDWTGRVLTIRREDLRTLASALGVEPAQLFRRLEELGLRCAT